MTYYVYILASTSRALYTGVTNDLERRVREHKSQITSGFSSQYRIDRLVYFEEFQDIRDVIEAEKRIKGWRRSKKLDLIQQENRPGATSRSTATRRMIADVRNSTRVRFQPCKSVIPSASEESRHLSRTRWPNRCASLYWARNYRNRDGA
jgi:putative endonuclease